MEPTFSPTLLDRALLLATVVLGLFHAWVGRHAMNHDGMSYLDVGTSFFCRDWANAVNAYWSPAGGHAHPNAAGASSPGYRYPSKAG